MNLRDSIRSTEGLVNIIPVAFSGPSLGITSLAKQKSKGFGVWGTECLGCRGENHGKKFMFIQKVLDTRSKVL